LSQNTIHSIRIRYCEPLEPCQLADFRWQRRELIVAGLKARDDNQIMILLPQEPHFELLQTGQQTELGRKRRELVAGDLKTPWLLVRSRSNLRQSHPEVLERCQVRNFARQRAKRVVEEEQSLHVLHAEQLGRHLGQIHVIQLMTIV